MTLVLLKPILVSSNLIHINISLFGNKNLMFFLFLCVDPSTKTSAANGCAEDLDMNGNVSGM
jgi:hypothetical protein